MDKHFDQGLDAVFLGADKEIYLFKEEKYQTGSIPGVMDIKDKWGLINNNFTKDENDQVIDGAFVDEQGYLFVFKGDQYIRYTDTNAD